MANGSLSREQVLDELEFLATVEHALIVEYLSVCCALGHNLLEAGEGGPTTDEGRAGAGVAAGLAMGEMFDLKRVNRGLVSAGRGAQVGRANSIFGDSGEEIALGPPSLAQLRQLVERGHGIAAAVDRRYTRLSPAVTSDPVFDGDVLDEMRQIIVEQGPTHAETFGKLRNALGNAAVADLLRATRREPADGFEQRLLNVSDRCYGLIVSALREWFARDDFTFRSLALEAMQSLDEINQALAGRGLLPSFSA